MQGIKKLPKRETWEKLKGLGLVKGEMPENAFIIEGSEVDAGTDLSGAWLRGADFRVKELYQISFQGADLAEANFERANLDDSDFQGAYLRRANFKNSTLCKCNFQNCIIDDANLEGSRLDMATLENAQLNNVNLERANLYCTNLSGASCVGANFNGANFFGAKIKNVNMARIKFDRKGKFQGAIGLESVLANPLFVRFARDQEYIEVFKERHPILFWLWWIFTDCGRSLWPVVLWGLGVVIIFGLLFSHFSQDFIVHNLEDGKVLTGFTYFYYSIVTFSTLGYGDVSAKTLLGEIMVAIEVILGYVVLGLLVSILANKVARRS